MAHLTFAKALSGFTAFKRQLFIPPIQVTGPAGFSAFIYECYINVDWDGAHRAYGLDRPDEPGNTFPYQKGLEPHEKGERLWTSGRHQQNDYWVGIYSANEHEARNILQLNYPGWNTMSVADRERIYKQFHDKRTSTRFGRSLKDTNGRFPIVQLPGFNGDDKDKGYYVSQANAVVSRSAYQARPWDQRVYIDAAEVPYVVVPKLAGVSKGDYGLVIRNKTGRTTAFIFGDSANKDGSTKLGECSGHIFTYLAEGSFNEEAYTFIVFPKTGNGEADNAAVANTDDVVWARMQLLATPRHQPARELALQLALGKDYAKSVAKREDLTGQAAMDYRNIGLAFTYYGLNVTGAKDVAKGPYDEDYVPPTSMALDEK
jgi:hypothetical protein